LQFFLAEDWALATLWLAPEPMHGSEGRDRQLFRPSNGFSDIRPSAEVWPRATVLLEPPDAKCLVSSTTS